MEFIQYPRGFGKITMLENESKRRITESGRTPLFVTVEIEGNFFHVVLSACYWNAEA